MAEPINEWPNLAEVVKAAIEDALDGIAFPTGMIGAVSLMTRDGATDVYVYAAADQSHTVSIGLARQCSMMVEGVFRNAVFDSGNEGEEYERE